MSLDTALKNTGYAIFGVNKDFSFQFFGCGEYETNTHDDRSTRIRATLNFLDKMIQEFKINVIITEEPPAVFDKFKSLGVVKLSAACGAVIGYCQAKGIYVREMGPSTWQAGFPKRPKGKKVAGETKVISVHQANAILKYLGSSRHLLMSEHHAADAMNIGVFTIKQWHSGKWKAPYESV